MRIDLHNHSHHSHDSSLHPDDLKSAAVDHGIYFIALTDHDTIGIDDDYFISGCEFTTKSGHLLGLFINECKVGEKPVPVEVAVEKIREQDGVVVVPHPLKKGSGFSKADIDEHIDEIDAIEIYNPDNTFYGNKVASEIATDMDVCMVTGSDAHTASAVGRGSTEVEQEISSQEELRQKILGNELEIAQTDRYGSKTSSAAVYYVLLYLEMFIRESNLYDNPSVKKIAKYANMYIHKYFLNQEYR